MKVLVPVIFLAMLPRVFGDTRPTGADTATGRGGIPTYWEIPCLPGSPERLCGIPTHYREPPVGQGTPA